MDTLIRLAKSGNTQAFGEIYKQYVKIIYNFVYQRVGHKEQTQDLVSDIFIKIFRNLHSFKTGTNFKAWILTISRNTINDFWKQQIKQSHQSFEESIYVQNYQDQLQRFFEYIDQDLVDFPQENKPSVIDTYLSMLKEKERQVITRRFVHSQSVKSTAESLGLSQSNVKVITHRALKKLSSNHQLVN